MDGTCTGSGDCVSDDHTMSFRNLDCLIKPVLREDPKIEESKEILQVDPHRADFVKNKTVETNKQKETAVDTYAKDVETCK